jgi:hypothetical protein
MTESTCFETVGRFCQAVVAVFRKDYVRALNEQDNARILAQNAARGFPEVLGSTMLPHLSTSPPQPAREDKWRGTTAALGRLQGDLIRGSSGRLRLGEQLPPRDKP